MNWSLGEIRALSVKAARGAGMDWGMAEEAGFAVEWLEARNLAGTKAMADYLSIASLTSDFKYDSCPLKLGCMVSDLDDWNHANKAEIFQPLLLLPFVAALADKQPILLSWDNSQVCVLKDVVYTSSTNTHTGFDKERLFKIRISTEALNEKPLEFKTRVNKDAETHVKTLTQLAHKTYAPATEASRLAGAGAGLNDND